METSGSLEQQIIGFSSYIERLKMKREQNVKVWGVSRPALGPSE